MMVYYGWVYYGRIYITFGMGGYNVDYGGHYLGVGRVVVDLATFSVDREPGDDYRYSLKR